MRHYGGASRRELFERLDQPALRPLPADALRVRRVEARAGQPRLPHRRRAPRVLGAARARARSASRSGSPRRRVEVFHARPPGGRHIARSAQRGGFTTDPAHMPKAHQAHHEWTPSRFIALGRHDRAADRGARRGDPRRPPASRAGLPLLSRHPPARQTLRRRRASKPRVRGRSPPARARIGTSTRSCERGLDRAPDRHRPRPRRSTTRTSAAATTTTEQEGDRC